jgi:hypothetical protein
LHLQRFAKRHSQRAVSLLRTDFGRKFQWSLGIRLGDLHFQPVAGIANEHAHPAQLTGCEKLSVISNGLASKVRYKRLRIAIKNLCDAANIQW